MPSHFPFLMLKTAVHKTRNIMACITIFHISKTLLIISNADWLIGFPPKCNPCMPVQSRHTYTLKAAFPIRHPYLRPVIPLHMEKVDQVSPVDAVKLSRRPSEHFRKFPFAHGFYQILERPYVKCVIHIFSYLVTKMMMSCFFTSMPRICLASPIPSRPAPEPPISISRNIRSYSLPSDRYASADAYSVILHSLPCFLISEIR